MLHKTTKGQEVIERYKKALSYIESFSNTSVKKGEKGSSDIFIRRTRHILGRLGNPQNGLKIVHVTGTAGKGTASAFIHEMLVRDGKKAGLFTSPYATAAIEEIKVGGLYISPADFADVVDALKPVVEETGRSIFGRPTSSELFFILAVLYFHREECEWAVVEAGIGGRYDATNVIEHPIAAVITNIDYDHTGILGKRLIDIAADKAGIIKRGSLFFTTESKKAPLSIFKGACAREGALFHKVKKGSSSQGTGRALAAAVCQSLHVSPSAIAALEEIELPCRFEKVSVDPVVILDGAHNRIKMRSVSHNLRSLVYEKLHLVLGVGNMTSDSERMFPEIVPLADSLILAGSGESKRKLSNPEAIEPIIRRFLKKGVAAEIALDPQEALRKALDKANDRDCILVTGSFFLVGELRKNWFSESWVLEHRRSFK